MNQKSEMKRRKDPLINNFSFEDSFIHMLPELCICIQIQHLRITLKTQLRIYLKRSQSSQHLCNTVTNQHLTTSVCLLARHTASAL